MADSDLIRGNVDTLILKVLYDGDRYGYDMIKQINARSGGQWEVKQPTVYDCLRRLEKQGFVSSYWDESESDGGRRKYFSLTKTGREVFVSYKSEFERTRDLFGSLISEDDAMLPVENFSDVEEDSYQIPKRRAARSRKPKQTLVPPEKTETEQKSDSSIKTEPVSQPEPQSQPDEQARYVQQTFFTDNAESEQPNEPVSDAEVRADENTPNASEEAADAAEENREEAQSPDKIAAREEVNPRDILEKIYSESYSEKSSYSGSSNRRAYEITEDIRHTEQSLAIAAPVIKNDVAPTVENDVAPAPPPHTELSTEVIGGESLARREYKDILGDLVARTEKREPQDEAAAADRFDEDGERVEIRRFDDVIQSVQELGNSVTVRDHNDSAKVYNHKFYYYSNRLAVTHYTVMCAVMFILGLTAFLTFYFGLNMRMRYDYLLYIFAGLFPIALFIGAVVIFACNPDKKKRINVNFRSAIIIRTVIMLQAAVIIYWLNVIWGMPVGFSANYAPSLVIPLIYALFIPISEVIFMNLLKSERYAVQ